MKSKTPRRLAAAGVAALALVGAGIVGVQLAADDSLTLTRITEDETSITLGWTPQEGAGYFFFADGRRVSWTADPTRDRVRFSNRATKWDVEVIPKPTVRGTYPPPAPVPDPKIKWPAPALTSPTTVAVTNSNRFLDLAIDRDYVVDLPNTALTTRGGLTIKGGRNIVIKGGEIRQDIVNNGTEGVDLQYGLYLLGATGTVHIEGLWIHGVGLGQGIVVMPDWGAGRPFAGTIQIQNTRIEALHPVGRIHTDGIQSGSGPAVLRLFNVTFRSNGLSIQVQPGEHGNLPLSAMRQWDYENVSAEHLSNLAPALNKTAFPGNGWWPETHKNLWLKPHPNHGKPIHCSWQGLPDCWNPGGGTNVSGEALRIGLPPSDFAPANAVGLNYAG